VVGGAGKVSGAKVFKGSKAVAAGVWAWAEVARTEMAASSEIERKGIPRMSLSAASGAQGLDDTRDGSGKGSRLKFEPARNLLADRQRRGEPWALDAEQGDQARKAMH